MDVSCATWLRNRPPVNPHYLLPSSELPSWTSSGAHAQGPTAPPPPSPPAAPDPHFPCSPSWHPYLGQVDSSGGYHPTYEAVSYESAASHPFWYWTFRIFAFSVFFIRWLWELYVDFCYRHFYITSKRQALLKLLLKFWRIFDLVLLAMAIYAFCLQDEVDRRSAEIEQLIRSASSAPPGSAVQNIRTQAILLETGMFMVWLDALVQRSRDQGW